MKKNNNYYPLRKFLSLFIILGVLFVSVFSVAAYSIAVPEDKNTISYSEPKRKSISLLVCENGNKVEYSAVYGITVGEFFKENSINITETKRVNYSVQDKIFDGMKIVIQNVEIKTDNETLEIEFETKTQTSDDLYEDETEVNVKGENGQRVIVSKKEYVDGELVKTTVIKDEITKQPTTCIKTVGTKKRQQETAAVSANSADVYETPKTNVSSSSNTFVDCNGNTVSYQRAVTGSGTAYTANPGALTATGVEAYFGGVAVNPSIIPYGSKLYIVSSDNSCVYGYATAVDTGGALMDGSAIVDVFYPSYDQCVQFGRRDVIVYVL